MTQYGSFLCSTSDCTLREEDACICVLYLHDTHLQSEHAPLGSMRLFTSTFLQLFPFMNDSQTWDIQTYIFPKNLCHIKASKIMPLVLGFIKHMLQRFFENIFLNSEVRLQLYKYTKTDSPRQPFFYLGVLDSEQRLKIKFKISTRVKHI